MAYTKIDLVEPIYELQDRETPRQHYFAELYYEVSDENLSAFVRSFNGLKKGSKWVDGRSEIELEFNPPTKSTFEQWVYCLQYKARRRAYWDDKFKQMRKERKKKAEKFLKSFQDNLQDELESNKRIANEIEHDDKAFPHLKGKGKEHIASANRMTWDMYKEVTGVEVANTDTNVNLNVDADVKQQNTAELKAAKLNELRMKMDGMTYD